MPNYSRWWLEKYINQGIKPNKSTYRSNQNSIKS